jgi:hypothetical protein
MGHIKSFLLIWLLSFAPGCYTAPLPETSGIPITDYDVVIIGGGLDSGEYRNGLTRHMHDVIGNDG